jgi:hypothetical protein
MTEVQFLAGAMREFFLFTTASILALIYPMGNGGSYPKSKAARV